MTIAEYKIQPEKETPGNNRQVNGLGKPKQGLSPFNRFLKRSFDFFVSSIGLILTGWIIVLAYIAASIDTRKSGFFCGFLLSETFLHVNLIPAKYLMESDH